MQFSRRLARWFPVPRLLAPNVFGVDITDTSVKWLSFKQTKHGRHIDSYGSVPIPPGVVERGAIKDTHKLAAVLSDIKKKHGVRYAHAALPEEDAYIFSMHVPPGSSRKDVKNMLEFELETRVPIPAAQAVYDFDTVFVRDDNGEEIAVSVFPRDLADGYVEAFELSGIELFSLEIEARSIARAVSVRGQDVTTMLVDSGFARTGIAILKNGIPIFSSTIDLGGYHLSKAVMTVMNVGDDEARVFKNEHGLIADYPEGDKVREALEKVASQLAGEIAKHYRFWDTRRNERGEQMTPVERVFILGGSANLRGFSEYVAGRVHVPTERPDVWRNAFSLDDYIPSIDRRTSFQYATAIGLALRGI